MRPSALFAVWFAVMSGCSGAERADESGSQALGAGAAYPMGAVVTSTGATFRVWAPNASSVAVDGDFNGWTDAALTANGDGTFSAAVAAAKAGQHYHYVLNTPGSGRLVRQDPRALEVQDIGGDSILYDDHAYVWTSTAFQPPAFSQQVLYELHLATFNDPTGNGGGTWNSAAQKLDYLKALGINMVEVMPIDEFPGSYSWGYNPSFPFAPETHYGSPDDAKAFVDQAHAHGIGVILDVVHNHWGGGSLPMWCFDGPCFGKGNGGIYFYTGARQNTGFGPRPDYGRQEVRDYIADNAVMWLQSYRMDGLRWDSVVNIRRAAGQDLPDGWALLQRANNASHAVSPGKILIAEDLQGFNQITRPVNAGGAGFDSQWDPGFFYPVRAALTSTSDAARDMNQVAGAISHQLNGTASQRVIFTEDHDTVAPQNGPDKGRIPALVTPGNPGDYYAQKRSTLGATLALTSPGIPMLFMGQEFLESTPFPFSPGKAMDWSKETTYGGILQMYQRLIALRQNADGTTGGLTGDNVSTFHVNNNAKVIAFRRSERTGPGNDVVVVANFSNRTFTQYEVGLPHGGTWHVRFNGDSKTYSPLFNGTPDGDVTAVNAPRDGLPFNGTVALGPYSAIILSQ